MKSNKKVFEIIQEVDLDNKETVFDKKRSSHKQRRGEVQVLESDQDDMDVLGDMMQGRVSIKDDFKSVESEINELKFNKRKQIKMPKK